MSSRPPRSLASDRMVDPGGAALIGGVMMMNGDRVSAAVRGRDGSIWVDTLDVSPRPWARRLRKIPLLRGLAALATSMSASVAALLWSARVNGMSDDQIARMESSKRTRYFAIAFALVLCVAPFLAIHGLLSAVGGGPLRAGLAEAVLRLAILTAYIWAVGRWGRVADVFAYHGAEHKTIACYEAGEPLVPEVVAHHSRFHPRCGTAFAFWAIMVISAVGAVSGDLGTLAGAAVRLGALALAVSLGYEIVRAGAKAGTGRLARALRAPGLVLQHLTTREPSLGHIETAIHALRESADDAQRAAIDAAVARWDADMALLLGTAA
ncbi:MAG TPA: DUF1385 domain-containing protein [Acidimicrobiales bacterium]|nr:DUF1385 domain-containing protein [Acidimicrobiales bacterium]